tara:strand:+ start:873 stop:1178 length:306 start_codon:yes stop_codon:yes gene_type:complete
LSIRFGMTQQTTPPNHPAERPADHDARLSDGPTIAVKEVKQGRGGLRILWVLLASLTLIVILFAIIYAARAPGLSQTEAETDARPMPAELQPQPQADVVPQ